MRPATYYYMAQVWPPHGHRQIEPDAPSRAASRDRRAQVSRRGRSGRDLPGVARRLLAVLSGTTSQEA